MFARVLSGQDEGEVSALLTIGTNFKRMPKNSAIKVSDSLMQCFKNKIDKPWLTGQLPIIVNQGLLAPGPGFEQGEGGRIVQVQPQNQSVGIFLLFIMVSLH